MVHIMSVLTRGNQRIETMSLSISCFSVNIGVLFCFVFFFIFSNMPVQFCEQFYSEMLILLRTVNGNKELIVFLFTIS